MLKLLKDAKFPDKYADSTALQATLPLALHVAWHKDSSTRPYKNQESRFRSQIGRVLDR